MSERPLHGALTFLGFALSIMAVFYFSVHYIPRVSPWSQVGSLALMGLAFAYGGVYLQATPVGQPFFDGPRLRWLRPAVVLYLLAILCGITADIVFLGIDDLEVPIKILATLALGLGLIIWVARRRPPAPAAQEPAPSPAPKARAPSRRRQKV